MKVLVYGVASWTLSCACVQEFEGVWRRVSAAESQRMALVWESEELLKLNQSIMKFIKDQARRPLHHRLFSHKLVPGRMNTCFSPFKDLLALCCCTLQE